MRAALLVTLALTLLLAAPATLGHDADAFYAPEIIILHGNGSGVASLVMTMPGWTCGTITTTTTTSGFIHEVTCTPPTAPPGLVPGCTEVYAGAISWFKTPGAPMTHFPSPSLAPVGTLQTTTSCMYGGLVMASTDVLSPAPGIAYKGEGVEVHIDALHCKAEETWVTGTASWVAQCAANAGFEGTGP